MKVLIEKIDRALEAYFPLEDKPQSKIYEAMRYSLFAGGKRLRPVLMLECAKMCGGKEEEVMPFACALEMIHTYSLIHDDLPAMDDDDLRRGKPTCHIKFGEGIAVLAGDALLNKAFEIVTSYCQEGISAQTVLRAASVLAVSSGTEGMIGGQVIDLESEGKDIDLSQLQYLHTLKTGAIIRSACKIGVLLAGGDEVCLEAVDCFAMYLGLAFQIQDDILDVEGTTEALGKPVGSDRQSGKNTYVRLAGIETSKELVKEYSQKAVNALEQFGSRAAFLKELTNTLIYRVS